jgi:hypothetical protein
LLLEWSCIRSVQFQIQVPAAAGHTNKVTSKQHSKPIYLGHVGALVFVVGLLQS